MRICLDIGHMGKRSSPADRGAVHQGYREADLALTYAVAAWKLLEAKRHIVYLLCHDNYSARLAFCESIKADVHVQCHLNAAGGRYALVAYRDDAPASSARLASIMARNIERNAGDAVSNVKLIVLGDEDRGYLCLKPDAVSMLYEPLFIDNAEHLDFLINRDGLNLIGAALTDAIDQWAQTA